MQNKPNLLNAQMNVRSLITVDYENITNWTLGENKPNSKPIKPKTNPIKPNFYQKSGKTCAFDAKMVKISAGIFASLLLADASICGAATNTGWGPPEQIVQLLWCILR